MNRENLSAMDELMNALVQTNIWMTMQQNDPFVLAANERLDEALEAVKDAISSEQMNELRDALGDCTCAFEFVAILYGMQAVLTIKSVQPDDLSRFIYERTNGGTK